MDAEFNSDSSSLSLSPIITPDWRHLMGVRIVSRPRRKNTNDTKGRYATAKRLDPLTLRYVKFLRKVLGYTSERGMRVISKKHPDLFVAEKVSQEATQRPLEIRARALAGQTDRAISRAVGLPVPAVAAYLGLFFDVRERLRAKSWIRRIAIGIPIEQPRSVESLLLLHAWKRGPALVEPWFDFLQHQMESHDLGTRIGQQRAAIQLLVDCQQLPNEPEIRKSLQKKFTYIVSKLPQIPKTASIGGVVARNVDNILREIPWKQSGDEDFSTSQNRRAARHKAESLEFGQFAKAG